MNQRRVLILLALAGASAAAPWARGQAVAPAVEAGVTSLFNGRDLEGWDGEKQFWSVEDGAITGRTTADNKVPYNKFIIWNGGEVADFDLELEYRIEGGNSGIQVRSFRNPDPKKEYSIQGYQADFDAARGWAGTCYGEGFGGVLAKRGQKVVLKEKKEDTVVTAIGDPAELQAAIKEGDWNEYRVVARGNTLRQFINGRLMSELVDDRPTARASGLLALQLHGGPPMKVQFRNIRLRRLPVAATPRVVFLAGGRSHGPGEHEFNAGCRLLARALEEQSGLGVRAEVLNGWPADDSVLDGARAVVIYADGTSVVGKGWAKMDALVKQGVGIMFMHYAVHPSPAEGEKYYRPWIGGAFETGWSVNPHWVADLKALPDHPVSRGVGSVVEAFDEFYYNMRFPQDRSRVLDLVTATPTRERMKRYINLWNEHGVGGLDRPQTIMWGIERADGGRGVGFTGGHYHRNWAVDGFRTLVLNAIVWVAGIEVPGQGVKSLPLTAADLNANLDDKGPKKVVLTVPQPGEFRSIPTAAIDTAREAKFAQPAAAGAARP